MNRLAGRILAIESADGIHLIDVDIGHDRTCTATVITDTLTGCTPGQRVSVLFKETEVALARDLAGTLSLRNRLACTVRHVDAGRILARIVLDCEGDPLESVITTRAARQLALAPGVAVLALVKASEVIVLPEPA